MEPHPGHSRMTPSALMSGQFWRSGEGRCGGVDGRKGVVVVLMGGKELWWCGGGKGAVVV